MKRSRFGEEQIIGSLRERDARVSAADLCSKHGVSDGGIYKWKAKYAGIVWPGYATIEKTDCDAFATFYEK